MGSGVAAHAPRRSATSAAVIRAAVFFPNGSELGPALILIGPVCRTVPLSVGAASVGFARPADALVTTAQGCRLSGWIELRVRLPLTAGVALQLVRSHLVTVLALIQTAATKAGTTRVLPDKTITTTFAGTA